MRILLVDDDKLLTQTLTSFLTSQYYAVDVATDGETGWEYTQAATYDLIVLDINLPKLNGVHLCQKLRQNKCSSPILLLTAKGESSDKVMGLDAGADDYLVKPCTCEELSARIRALLRRRTPSANPLLEWGDLCLDPVTCEVTYKGQLLTVSPKEYSLLELFLRNPQRIFSSSVILEHLWAFEKAPGEETVRTHIKRLRQKLKSIDTSEVIETVYGMGYRLIAPSAPSAAAKKPSMADQARTTVIGLWEQFKQPTLERMISLDRAMAALRAGNLSEDLRQAAARDAHKLAGSLGMFGFSEGSRLGREIEDWLETIPGANGIEPLQSLIAALHQELQRSPHSPGKDLLPSLHSKTADSSTPSQALLSMAGTNQISHNSTNLQIGSQGSGVASTVAIDCPQVPLQNDQIPTRSRSSQIKVLALDDDALVLKTLQQWLTIWGIHPVTLNNPLQLWDVLEREMPDLLILDVDMPHINGIELCQVLRNHHAWNGLPILFLTAHRAVETVLQLYSAGADDYVAKPFTEPEIITRIFNRLERNRQLQTWRKPSPIG